MSRGTMATDRDGSGRFGSGNRAGEATRFKEGNTAGMATRFGAEGPWSELEPWDAATFATELGKHFHRHGMRVLNRIKREKPVDYLKLCLQVVPKQPPPRTLDEELDGFSDAELAALLRRFRGELPEEAAK